VDYLVALLEHPGWKFHVSDLDRGRTTLDPTPPRAEAERMRKAVTNRIRATVSRIRLAHPELADHLEEAIQTGVRCSYRPSVPVHWEIVAERS
jgi:hypothetical protein